jgi:hypothetical protein
LDDVYDDLGHVEFPRETQSKKWLFWKGKQGNSVKEHEHDLARVQNQVKELKLQYQELKLELDSLRSRSTGKD